jgi:hypothetical protein
MRFMMISMSFSFAVAVLGSDASMAQEIQAPLQHQFDVISGALQSQQAISKNDVVELFQIKGDGAVTGHHTYGKNSDGSVKTSTIYSFATPSIPLSTELRRVDMEVIDGSSRILRLSFYPQNGACIGAKAFMTRYGLTPNTGSSEPNPGAKSIAYANTLNGGNFDIYVPASQQHDVDCVSEIHVFANMR